MNGNKRPTINADGERQVREIMSTLTSEGVFKWYLESCGMKSRTWSSPYPRPEHLIPHYEGIKDGSRRPCYICEFEQAKNQKRWKMCLSCYHKLSASVMAHITGSNILTTLYPLMCQEAELRGGAYGQRAERFSEFLSSIPCSPADHGKILRAMGVVELEAIELQQPYFKEGEDNGSNREVRGRRVFNEVDRTQKASARCPQRVKGIPVHSTQPKDQDVRHARGRKMAERKPKKLSRI